ncbi:MAG: transcriptional regulator [Gammaproteobacteria bacterium]
MALSRDYKETVRERAKRDPDFAAALMNEAISAFLEGDPETARSMLRELVNSTVGFEYLSKQLNKSSKSVHRMLSPKGNPTMDNLTQILVTLQKKMDFEIKVNNSPRS